MSASFEKKPVEVANWVIYAGPSLTDAASPPIQLYIVLEVYQRLYGMDPQAWGGLINSIEHEIAEAE